jgi:uroporphyrinogen-III synthase
MAVLLTRPLHESQEMASVFEKRGVEVYIAPLLQISYFPLKKQKSEKIILVTSQHAIYALSQSDISLETPLICVGDSTAAAAQKLGYTQIQSARGSVEDLEAYIIEHFNPHRHHFLYACGEVTHGDLEKKLHNLGFDVSKEIVYQAISIGSFPLDVVCAFQEKKIQYICVFSRRTAQILKEIMISLNLQKESSHINIIAFSSNIAEEFNGGPWKSIRFCPSAAIQEFWKIAEKEIFR